MKRKLFVILFIFNSFCILAQTIKHNFTLGKRDFLLDGQPFQIISGEMHPARIPETYWRHRIQMTKAMGCNTVSAYIFWNFHEISEGVYDFTSPDHDLATFIRIAQEEKMWVILRPGPYVCAEWDWGGIPSYLLKIPDIKVRCMDSRYISAVNNYIKKLADIIKPLQIHKGGPVLMLQIENEYGSYGNDREYLHTLEKIWRDAGIEIPFFTGDGPTPYMLEAGSLPGAASGLDSGSDQGCFDLAYKMNPDVPVFSSETYPGWLTHWGEGWQKPDTTELIKEVRFLMENHKSFNFYVIHGGTNFGFTAGANSGGKGYEPDVTSYDYDAPINEQGAPTAKYYALRKLLASYLPPNQKLTEIPPAIPVMEIPAFQMTRYASIWDQLPLPVHSVQPKPFEAFDQNQGFMVYKTVLIGHKSGKLVVTDIHDYASVYLDGVFIGTLDRKEGIQSLEIPKTASENPVLEILAEGMGHINFAQNIIDRKGITDRVTLNGMTLMNWEIYKLPMDENMISQLKPSSQFTKPGIFFKGTFTLSQTADTYFEMKNYVKGIVWINGHNLGRFWDIGPQFRLFCPAKWLKSGENEIIVFDNHLLDPKPIKGLKNLDSQ